MNNAATITWIKTVARTCRWVTSVCTGALLLHHAGLLSANGSPPTAILFKLFEIAAMSRCSTMSGLFEMTTSLHPPVSLPGLICLCGYWEKYLTRILPPGAARYRILSGASLQCRAVVPDSDAPLTIVGYAADNLSSKVK